MSLSVVTWSKCDRLNQPGWFWAHYNISTLTCLLTYLMSMNRDIKNWDVLTEQLSFEYSWCRELGLIWQLLSATATVVRVMSIEHKQLKISRKSLTVFSARQHAERAICYRPSVRPSVCLSVHPSICPSVRHTGGSVKNSWTYHRNSFTIW